MPLQNAVRPATARPVNEPPLSSGEADNSKIAHNRPGTQARNPAAVREVKLELLREAIHEACGFIRLHGEACQNLAEAGDDAGLLHSLSRLISYTRFAAKSGNDLRTIRAASP